MKSLHKIIITLCVFVALFAVFFFYNNKTKEGETLVIGGAFSLTGDAAEWGLESQRGAEIAIEEINEADGISGKKIKMFVEDTHSTSKDTISAVQKLKSIHGAKQFIASWIDVYQGVEGVVSETDLVVSPDAGIEAVNEKKLHKNMFSLWYRTGPKSEVVAKHIASSGKKNMFLVLQQDTYYETVEKFMVEYAKKYGVSIAGVEKVTADSDMKTIMAKVKNSGADAVFFAMYDEQQYSELLKWRKNYNLTMPFYGDEFTYQQFETKKYTELLEGAYYYGPEEPNNSFVKKYQDKYKTIPKFGAAPAYDAVMMIVKSVESSPENPVEYMRQNSFDSVTYDSSISFDAINGVKSENNRFFMRQIVGGVSLPVK